MIVLIKCKSLMYSLHVVNEKTYIVIEKTKLLYPIDVLLCSIIGPGDYTV